MSKTIVGQRNFRTNKRRNFSICGGQTIKVGEACIVYDELGRSELHIGPKRMWRRGAHTFQFIPKVVASSTEYLAITYHGGNKEHRMGPCFEWVNPVKYKEVKALSVTQVADQEAIVVYDENASTAVVSREIIYGPRTFVPTASQWVGRFSWHGPYSTKPQDAGRHKAGAFQQTRLSLTPANMSVHVKDSRTSDDCMLTVKLIVFYQLVDITTMLNTTQDPTGDLNAALCADVISMVAANTFEGFIESSKNLNSIETFPELSKRAPSIGFKIIKVVYLGYVGNATMQRMHDNSITTRTQQKLTFEKRARDMQLAEYTLGKQNELDQKRHVLAQIRQDHAMAMAEMKDDATSAQLAAGHQLTLDHQRAMHAEKGRKYDLLKEQGVDLTKYAVATAYDRNTNMGERTRVRAN